MYIFISLICVLTSIWGNSIRICMLRSLFNWPNKESNQTFNRRKTTPSRLSSRGMTAYSSRWERPRTAQLKPTGGQVGEEAGPLPGEGCDTQRSCFKHTRSLLVNITFVPVVMPCKTGKQTELTARRKLGGKMEIYTVWFWTAVLSSSETSTMQLVFTCAGPCVCRCLRLMLYSSAPSLPRRHAGWLQSLQKLFSAQKSCNLDRTLKQFFSFWLTEVRFRWVCAVKVSSWQMKRRTFNYHQNYRVGVWHTNKRKRMVVNYSNKYPVYV